MLPFYTLQFVLSALLLLGTLSSFKTMHDSVMFKENLLKMNNHFEAFTLWHQIHEKDKKYNLNSDEGLYRFKIFQSNLIQIKKRNEELSSFRLGPGPYSDLTLEEYRNKIVNKNEYQSKVFEKKNSSLKHFLLKTDNSWENKQKIKAKPINLNNEDWSAYFPKVRDQQSCGSCWAFSAIATIEGRLAKLNGKIEELSPQYLVDCSTKDEGCDGGFFDSAFEYIIENGICSEKEYPYDGKVHECKANPDKTYNFNRILYCNNSDDDEEFHCNYGLAEKCKEFLQWSPVATAVDASTFEFQHYSSGEFTGYCSELNHAVVITHINKDYIKIRNSWSDKWGENGYMIIKRDESNQSCLTESQCYALIDDS